MKHVRNRNGVLFVLLQPGLAVSDTGEQPPGGVRNHELKPNGKAIAAHTLIFFAIYAVLVLPVHVHIYTG